MTIPSHEASSLLSAAPSHPSGLRRLAQVCWDLRCLGLFLVGPVFGVILAGGIFGMARDLYWTAGVVFLFTLSMYALLVRGEWRRLTIDGER